MKFRTEIKIKDAPKKLSPERLLLLMGSCFSDYIGARMEESGWPVSINPCGVVYNPVSMALLVRLALMQRAIRREIVGSSITERDGRYVSWFVSSIASGETAEECVDDVCNMLDRLEQAIESCEAAILTFGTSDVWLLAGSDRAVGNCHKYPEKYFERKRAGVSEIVESWKELIEAIRMRNPDISVILTVSPRRYLSDGFEENTRQKAVLILACEKLCKECEGVNYFPAYEIMNDDLRDYRFYSKDLLHPSEMSVDYIWEKFKYTYLDSKGLEIIKSRDKEMKHKRHQDHLTKR